jgi:phosphate transport system ATP-binding protein
VKDSRSHLIVKNLNVHIGKKHILKNINVEIPDKKITCIIGPSGCGKTTLFKTFNRLLENTISTRITGNVLLDGQDLYAANSDIILIRKKMGLLNQRPTPLPMSIYANVVYGLKIHGIRKRKVLKEKAEYYLKMASLWDEVKDRWHEPASSLSIGQQQRLCLARGLAVEPEIILGDEATSALDPISSRWIEEKFLELKEKYTIILVTHILRQARRVADYIIFMYLGEIIEHGPAEEIFENPKETLTREYIKGVIS